MALRHVLRTPHRVGYTQQLMHVISLQSSSCDSTRSFSTVKASEPKQIYFTTSS